MSTYKLTFSSLFNAWANDEKISATGQAAGDSTNPFTNETYDLHVTLDGALVANGTIDGSAALSFDANLSTGDHNLIVTVQGAKQSGVCIDKIEIGPDSSNLSEVVATRLKYNNVVSGGSDLLRWQLAEIWRSSDDDDTYNVWWPQIMESSTALAHNFPYRPALLAGNEMHFNLTKNSNNILSLTDDYAGDTNSVMYDSTEPVKYYLAQKPNTKGSSNLQSSTLDVMSYVDSSAMRVGGWDDSTAEARGDSVDSTLGGYYAGPGQYDADLIWNSDNIDDSSDTATRVVVLSEKEWKQLYYNKLWLGENDLTAVTVT
jgi:hypothetical protein